MNLVTNFIEWASNQHGIFIALTSTTVTTDGEKFHQNFCRHNWTTTTTSTRIGPTKSTHSFEKDTRELIDLWIQQLFTGGIILTFFIKIILVKEDGHQTYKSYHHFLNSFSKQLITFLNIIFDGILFAWFIILSPIFMLIWFILSLYKTYSYARIKNKYGNSFIDFLEGTDSIWTVEEDTAKSVINILLTIDVPHSTSSATQPKAPPSSSPSLSLSSRGTSVGGTTTFLVSSSSSSLTSSSTIQGSLKKHLSCDGHDDDDVTDAIGEKLLFSFRTKMMKQFENNPKLFFKRLTKYGYSFWTKNEHFDIKNFIRYIDLKNYSELNNTSLTSIISNLSNESLPLNHKAGWEILISPRPFDLKNSNRNQLQYPILFRIHHSLGDGVALLKFFIDTFSDQNSNDLEKKMTENFNPKRKIQTKSLTMGQKAFLLFRAPSFLFKLMTKSIDQNAIHGPKLSGEKIIAFSSEIHNKRKTKKLIEIIKAKKNKIPGAKFCDVFLATISTSLKKYFVEKNYVIPDELTAVIPMRIEAPSNDTGLKNRFSVALQTIPIDKQDWNFKTQNITNVKEYTVSTLNSCTYQINYWIMSFLSSLLPNFLLEPIVRSVHSTLAVSNLPGPQCKITIENYHVNLLTFWLPNRGTTGIGITLFSYNNSIQFGIIADRNLISDCSDLNGILQNMERDLIELEFSQ